jgi:hypothetical protein
MQSFSNRLYNRIQIQFEKTFYPCRDFDIPPFSQIFNPRTTVDNLCISDRFDITKKNTRCQVRAQIRSGAEISGKYMIHYCNLCAKAHRNNACKAGTDPFYPSIIKVAPPYLHSEGWAERIRLIRFSGSS